MRWTIKTAKRDVKVHSTDWGYDCEYIPKGSSYLQFHNGSIGQGARYINVPIQHILKSLQDVTIMGTIKKERVSDIDCLLAKASLTLMNVKKYNELIEDAYTKAITPTTDPRFAFRACFKSKNIMTPHIVRYGSKSNFYYELSRGDGFRGDIIYGVTVLEYLGTTTFKPFKELYKHRTDLGQSFNSLPEANQYIKGLKNAYCGDLWN